jgi:pantoate--beta-alanine ligase
MDTLTRSASVRDRATAWRDAGARVALISTRGSLHKGHMSLVAEAQERAKHVIVSVFADPSQPQDRQPPEVDRELLANVGADVLFMPPVQEMFTAGRERSAVVSLPELEDLFEGAGRPGYLAAITTVHFKLLNIIAPDIVLFGERDFQQLVMMRRVVNDLFLSIEVVACPTFRDSDGLAVATRNRDLTPAERIVAPQLNAALERIAKQIDAGDRDYEALQRQSAEALNVGGFVIDYLQICQASDLGPIQRGTRDLVLLAAARLGRNRLTDSRQVRLIDHY